MIKRFRYPTMRKTKFDTLNRLPQVVEDEGLRGEVQGLPASDIEERTALAVGKRKVGFRFQVNIPVDVPGQQKQLDILAFTIPPQPINVHGYIGHHTAEQNGIDKLRDGVIDQYGQKAGWQPIRTLRQADLDNQDLADDAIRRIIG